VTSTASAVSDHAATAALAAGGGGKPLASSAGLVGVMPANSSPSSSTTAIPVFAPGRDM
jgi:hypothetical protein